MSSKKLIPTSPDFLMKTKILKAIYFLKILPNQKAIPFPSNSNKPFFHGTNFFFKTKNIYNFIKISKLNRSSIFSKIKLKNTLQLLNLSKVTYIQPFSKKASPLKKNNNLNKKIVKIKATPNTYNLKKLDFTTRAQIPIKTKTMVLNTKLTNLIYDSKNVVLNQKQPSTINTNTLFSVRKILNVKFLIINRFLKKSYSGTNRFLNTSSQKLLSRLKSKHSQNHFLNNNQDLTLCYYKYVSPKKHFFKRNNINTYNHLIPLSLENKTYKNLLKFPTHPLSIVNTGSQINKLYLNRTALLTVLYNPFLMRLLKNKNEVNSLLPPYYSPARSLCSLNILPNTIFSYIFTKKTYTSFTSIKFQTNLIPTYYNTLIRFVEFLSGNKVLFNFYPFASQSLSVN
jgi:hypothetical protein